MVPDSIVARVRFGHYDGDHLPLCAAELRPAEHECPVEVEMGAQRGGIEAVHPENVCDIAGGVAHPVIHVEKLAGSFGGRYHLDPSHITLLW